MRNIVPNFLHKDIATKSMNKTDTTGPRGKENMNFRKKEKEIFSAQAENSGKSSEIIEKMIGGRIRKFLAEISLVEQPFVKNPDQTVGQLAKASGASITHMVRFEVGEGIEKVEINFAQEVMAQARGK